MSKIKIFPRFKGADNQLIQMMLERNGKWYIFNNYMTIAQQIDAAEKLNSLNAEYVKENIELKQPIGVYRNKLVEECKRKEISCHTDFNRMFIHMNWNVK